MSLSSIVSRVIPAAVGFVTGGPVGAFTATVATEQQKSAEKQIKQQQAALAQERNEQMAEIFGSGNVSSIQAPRIGSTTTSNAGMGGGFFDTVGGFFRDVGGLTRDVFSSGIPQLLGYARPQNVGQQPALTTVTNVGARESAGSGSIQAGFGSLVPSLIGAGRSLVGSPAGQIGIGTAVGTALSLFDGAGRQVRITRKTKRLAQQAYALSMGDLGRATQLFAQLSGISVNEQQYVLILTKRFRNDGAVITKAALRKTRSTIRKMKSMCDMYDDLRPAARRRTPMKRATRSTTLIKN